MTPKRPTATHLGTFALLVTVTLVSFGLAVSTDLNSLLRSGIAVVSGVTAAALTTAAVSKRRGE